ncbi:protein stoned-B isoform X2 [Drosophila grimshawi]|uniref:protein stoned-B isoform X2 n=1 Tax=Drosophila grimshawi TaxID=7222 RepID=UPI000C86F32A|nr:protein stoned-B isoform X2 [Drosophila grimshawi]
MANPFLMDDDLDGGDAAVNPFLVQTETEPIDTDNPFGESASNPFAFGGDDLETEAEPAAAVDIDAAMSFFGTTIEAEDDALSLKSAAEEDDEGKKAEAPPPRPQPPQSTQELINTVSSQLDETSSELLGRIPDTRSPSPVSMRDLHSPSPTPDSGLADLLDVDVSDSGSSANTQAIEVDLMSGSVVAASPLDNPFGVPTALPNLQGAAPLTSPAKQQPPRPPPPRPSAPPRPTPPAHMMQGHGQQHPTPTPAPPQRPPPPSAAAPTAAAAEPAADADDLLDMFGSSTKPAKPPPPKTKEDILSLFEQPAVVVAPAAAAPPDLLNDDLPESNSRDEPIFSSMLIRPDDSTHDITSQPQAATVAHIAAPPETAQRQRAPTPDIEITTVEDLPRSDDEDEEPEPAPVVQPKQQQQSPTEIDAETELEAEPVPQQQQQQPDPAPAPAPEPELEPEPEQQITIESDQSPPTESAATIQAVHESHTELVNDEPEQMDTGLDFPGLASGQLSANPFASPEEEDEPSFAPAPIVSNIFAVDEPETEETVPPVVQPRAAPPIPQPAASYASNIFAVEPDEFDAFSAKFDSVKKDNISILDGFGSGSGAITPSGGDVGHHRPPNTGKQAELGVTKIYRFLKENPRNLFSFKIAVDIGFCQLETGVGVSEK